MKTISDIKENVETLAMMDRHARMETEKKYKQKIFEYYKGVSEIDSLKADLENMRSGDYFIDECGDLCYGIEISNEILKLPEIGDYLTSDYGWISDRAGYKLLCQCMGSFISVDFNHEKGTYFVFDHGTREPILKVREDWMTNEYVSAKIEQHMREKGEFGDVINTDRYGSYVSHYNTDLGNFTDEEINKLVSKFEEVQDE